MSAHQVPIATVRGNAEHLAQLEEWMRSYRPEELFDENGTLHAELRELAPTGVRRMGANPHANGGLLLRDLKLTNSHIGLVVVYMVWALPFVLWMLYSDVRGRNY